MKLTGTNKPITYTTHPPRRRDGEPARRKRATPGNRTPRPTMPATPPLQRHGRVKITYATRPLCGSQPTTGTTTQYRAEQSPHPARHEVTHRLTTSPPPDTAHQRTPEPGRNGSTSYGGHSVGETPGPIPNPEAKTHSADGTAPERVWESRTPPDNHYRQEAPPPVGPLPR